MTQYIVKIVDGGRTLYSGHHGDTPDRDAAFRFNSERAVTKLRRTLARMDKYADATVTVEVA